MAALPNGNDIAFGSIILGLVALCWVACVIGWLVGTLWRALTRRRTDD